MKKLWLFFRRFIYVMVYILTFIIFIPMNGVLILLSLLVIYPMYFLRGKIYLTPSL